MLRSQPHPSRTTVSALVLALAFLWPMLGLFRISLNRTAETGAMETALTTETYAKVAGDPYYWGLAWDTLVLSATGFIDELLEDWQA